MKPVLLFFILLFLFSIGIYGQQTSSVQTTKREAATTLIQLSEQETNFNMSSLRGLHTDTILNLLPCDTIFYLYAFHPADDGVIGYLSGHNSDLDSAKAEYYPSLPGDTFKGVWILFGKATYTSATAQKIHVKVWKADDPQGTPGTVLTTVNITHKSIADDVAAGKLTTVYFPFPIINPGPVYVGFEMDYKIEANQRVYSASRVVSLANPDINGNCADDSLENYAWEKYADGTWHSYWDSYLVASRNPVFPIINSLGCTVAINPSAVSICKGDKVTLTASGDASTYVWSPATNLNTTTGATVIATPKTTITYTVTGDAGNCSSSVTVTVNKKPKATVTAASCSGGTVLLTCIANPSTGVKYKWKKNGAKIGMATNSTYLATVSASYECKVTVTSTGCEKTSNEVSVSTNCKVAEPLGAFDITASPNPFSNTLSIGIISGSADVATITIMDIFGKTIDEFKSVEPGLTTLIGSNLSAGIYFVKVKQGENEKMIKVVKSAIGL